MRKAACVLVMLFAFGQTSMIASALSQEQKTTFNEGIHYFDVDTCDSAASSDISAPGNGAADGAQFPSLDPGSMTSAINSFINKENPRSELKGLGSTIVAGAQHSNISPFLIVAIAHEESNLADPSDYNVSTGSNSFGRMATPSQPHFSGSRLWYRWSSVKASVDYTARENQRAIGGGDFASYLRNQYGNTIDGSSLLDLFLKYAPPSENNTAQYTANVKGWIGAMVNAAGSTAASQNPLSGGGCCASNGNISDSALEGNGNVQKAFNYFVGKGLTAQQAAAIVGNFIQESNVEPEAVEGGGTSKDPSSIGVGWGIAQWTPGSKILGEASQYHITGPIYELATQLDIVWAEMEDVTPAGYNHFLDDFKKINDVGEATDFFVTNFEAAGIIGPRTAYAKKVLARFGGDVSGITVGDCGSSSSTGVSGYKNPFRDIKNLVPMRIDQGVDYGGSGPVYAIGNGTVTNLTNSGWPGGTFIAYKLLDGPAQGKYVYFAENCKNIKVHIGQKVGSNTVLCTMVDAYPHTETGWAKPPGAGEALAKSYGGYTEGYATGLGENFNQLLVKLGAPSGTQQPRMGTLPPGWPTW